MMFLSCCCAGDPHATRAVESGDSLPVCNIVFKVLTARAGDCGKVAPFNLTDTKSKYQICFCAGAVRTSYLLQLTRGE